MTRESHKDAQLRLLGAIAQELGVIAKILDRIHAELRKYREEETQREETRQANEAAIYGV